MRIRHVALFPQEATPLPLTLDHRTRKVASRGGLDLVPAVLEETESNQGSTRAPAYSSWRLLLRHTKVWMRLWLRVVQISLSELLTCIESANALAVYGCEPRAVTTYLQWSSLATIADQGLIRSVLEPGETLTPKWVADALG